MSQNDRTYGKPNPRAPRELSRFSFLIGQWRCDAKVKQPDGKWLTYQAAWLGRFILDGYAIADEYRMMDTSGALVVLGMNFRAYDPAEQTWNIKWLDALKGTWTDLGLEELGGVKFDARSVVYAFKEPMAPHAYTRVTYTVLSDTHFRWQGDASDDGDQWREFMVVDAYRREE